jgi:hypothetical protein
MEPLRTTAYDPVRFCIFTTIALLAWALSPPVVVAALSGVGLWAYWRARRQGLARSRCVLGDTRLVMAYLAAACLLGIVVTIRGLMG